MGTAAVPVPVGLQSNLPSCSRTPIDRYDFSSGGWIWNFGYTPSVKTPSDLCRQGARSFCYSMCCDAMQRYSPLCLSLSMSCY
jgi:hypothetical protein